MKSLPEYLKIVEVIAGEATADGDENEKKDIRLFTVHYELPDGSRQEATFPVAKASARLIRHFLDLKGRTLKRPVRTSEDPEVLHTLDFVGRKVSAAIVRLAPFDNFWILQKNQGNRVMQDDRVTRYMAEYARKEWVVTNQGIGLDTNGELTDGQHRLFGSLLGDHDLPTTLVWGLDPKARTKADTGLLRSAADIWDLNFRKSPASPPGGFVTSASLAVLRLFRPERGLRQDSFYVPIAEHHEKGLEWLYGLIGPRVEKKAGYKKLLSSPNVRAALLVAYKYDPTGTDQFARRLIYNDALKPGSDIARLFQYLGAGLKREGLWASYWTLLLIAHELILKKPYPKGGKKGQLTRPRNGSLDLKPDEIQPLIFKLIEDYYGKAETQIPATVLDSLSAEDEDEDVVTEAAAE